MAKRRNFWDAFKAKVALEALCGDKTIQEIAARYQVHPNQESTGKRQAIEGMSDVFARGGKCEGPTSYFRYVSVFSESVILHFIRACSVKL